MLTLFVYPESELVSFLMIRIIFSCDKFPILITDINFSRYLIWIGSDQEKTFGPTISGLIHDNLGPERVTLWDSKKRGVYQLIHMKLKFTWAPSSSGGRPDVMKLLKETYVSWGAEVVFITSNYQGNQEMMEGCKEAGIPAFVSLFNRHSSCD